MSCPVWYFRGDPDWVAYDRAACDRIEKAWSKKQKTMKLNDTYRLDFSLMRQVRMDDPDRWRAIKRGDSEPEEEEEEAEQDANEVVEGEEEGDKAVVSSTPVSNTQEQKAEEQKQQAPSRAASTTSTASSTADTSAAARKARRQLQKDDDPTLTTTSNTTTTTTATTTNASSQQSSAATLNEAEAKSYQSRITHLEAEVTSLKSQLNDSENDNISLNEQVKKLKQTIHDHTQTIESSQSKTKALQAELDALKRSSTSQSETDRAMIASLEKQLKAKEQAGARELKELKEAQTQAEAQKNTLQKELKTLQEQLKPMKELLDKEKKRAEAAEAATAQVQATLDTLRSVLGVNVGSSSSTSTATVVATASSASFASPAVVSKTAAPNSNGSTSSNLTTPVTSKSGKRSRPPTVAEGHEDMDEEDGSEGNHDKKKKKARHVDDDEEEDEDEDEVSSTHALATADSKGLVGGADDSEQHTQEVVLLDPDATQPMGGAFQPLSSPAPSNISTVGPQSRAPSFVQPTPSSSTASTSSSSSSSSSSAPSTGKVNIFQGVCVDSFITPSNNRPAALSICFIDATLAAVGFRGGRVELWKITPAASAKLDCVLLPGQVTNIAALNQPPEEENLPHSQHVTSLLHVAGTQTLWVGMGSVLKVIDLSTRQVIFERNLSENGSVGFVSVIYALQNNHKNKSRPADGSTTIAVGVSGIHAYVALFELSPSGQKNTKASSSSIQIKRQFNVQFDEIRGITQLHDGRIIIAGCSVPLPGSSDFEGHSVEVWSDTTNTTSTIVAGSQYRSFLKNDLKVSSEVGLRVNSLVSFISSSQDATTLVLAYEYCSNGDRSLVMIDFTSDGREVLSYLENKHAPSTTENTYTSLALYQPSQIVSLVWGGQLAVWDVNTKKSIKSIKAHTDTVFEEGSHIVADPTSGLVMTVGGNGVVKLWK